MRNVNRQRRGLVFGRWTFLLIILGIFAVVVFTVYCCSVQKKINMKQTELMQLEAERDELIDENEELRAMKAKGKDDENMERVAREKFGYIYPDEKVYVISP
ncbi:MAG: septum formation initiator family protein [Clostridia bacterium]|nr:septum formation initiator family protein [Clostridia bacterium]